MTFEDLQEAVRSLASLGDDQVLQRLKNKPFWLWDPSSHKQAYRANKGHCCFNHIIGLTTRDEIRKPLFDYERLFYQALIEPGFINSIDLM